MARSCYFSSARRLGRPPYQRRMKRPRWDGSSHPNLIWLISTNTCPRYLRQAWSAFAHDPAHGLTDVLGWPTSESDSKALMVLGLNSTLAVSRDATSWDLPCITTLGTPIDIKAIITADIVSIWHDEHLSTRSDREGSKRAVSVRKGESSELFMKDSAES